MMQKLLTLIPTNEQLIDLLIGLALYLIALAVLHFLKRVMTRRLEAWAMADHIKADPQLLSDTIASTFWFATLLVTHFAVRALPLPDVALHHVNNLFTILYATMSISLLIGGLKLSMDVLLRRRGSSLMNHKGRVLLPIIKGMAWVVALAFILENLGVEISTILAGLGVAGVAVGFAAQAVLGDLFSYFAILFDKPFQIGDFVLLSDDIRGDIEHIGLKTSRIRSLDGEQIVISNTDLTNSRVKNYRRMTRRRAILRFGVLYSTPADKLEALPGIVREIIDEVPSATFDRAHFVNFGDSSLDFEVVYYVESPDYVDYMDTRQSINLALVRALKREGLEFAFPTRTLHIHQDQGDNHA